MNLVLVLGSKCFIIISFCCLLKNACRNYLLSTHVCKCTINGSRNNETARKSCRAPKCCKFNLLRELSCNCDLDRPEVYVNRDIIYGERLSFSLTQAAAGSITVAHGTLVPSSPDIVVFQMRSN